MKAVDNYFEPRALFTVLFYTHVERDEDQGDQYYFLTNRLGDAAAKSPKGMFDNLKIPNDLSSALEHINKYYED